MLFICLNCDYEMEVTYEDNNNEEKQITCPKCGDTIFEVYRVGPCIKAL